MVAEDDRLDLVRKRRVVRLRLAPLALVHDSPDLAGDGREGVALCSLAASNRAPRACERPVPSECPPPLAEPRVEEVRPQPAEDGPSHEPPCVSLAGHGRKIARLPLAETPLPSACGRGDPEGE